MSNVPPAHELTVDLRREHLDAFLRHSAQRVARRPRLRRAIQIFGFCYWLLLVLAILYGWEAWREGAELIFPSLRHAALALAAWVALSLIWPRVYLNLYLREHLDHAAATLGRGTLSFDSTGIEVRSARSQARLDWSCVETLERDKLNVYLYLDSLKALILPRDQLGTACEAFIAEHLPAPHGKP